MTITNAADGHCHVSWIDRHGEQHHADALRQGETIMIDAFSGHYFMISDDAGNCLELATASLGQPSFEMTAPGLAPDQD